MIALTVKTFNGAPMAQALSAQFDEMGGSIGRADNNLLVLPDPERTISRVHAKVVYRNGQYAIVDCGSNPVSVNGRPLGNGQESPLRPGDQVAIGGYNIQVDAGAAAQKVVDPFADFGGLAAPASAPRAGAGFEAADPLAGFGGPPPAAFGSPSSGAGGFPAPFNSPAPATLPATAGIPEDWDPFAAASPAATKKTADPFASASGGRDFGMEVGGKGAAPLIADFGGASPAASPDSLDNLFGLGPASTSSTADPFANTPLQAIHAQPNMAASDDPLKSLNSLTRASAASAADTLSELQSPFNLPPMSVPGAPAARPPAPPPAPAAPRPAAPTGAVLSWDDAPAEGRTIIRGRIGGASKPAPAAPAPAASPLLPPAAAAPAVPAPALPDDFDLGFGIDLDLDAKPAALAPVPASPPPAAPSVSPPSPPAAARLPEASKPSTASPPVAAPPMATPSTSGSGSEADNAALLAAFREGLAIHGLPIERLTPELMKLIGQLLHESVRGTVDLLVARAALKREVRAELTMIVAKENNPLKFSPSAEVAMDHLLKPPARGFMPADKAMRDAYDDLRAHQFGFLAGMRAALEGVLKRFDPAVLEGKLTSSSLLSSLIPGSRKARMWDAFQELYAQISAEASDDFHELFGKEFLRAYEAQLDKLQDERR